MEEKHANNIISCQTCLIAMTGKSKPKPINMKAYCKKIFEIVSDWRNTTESFELIQECESFKMKTFLDDDIFKSSSFDVIKN